MRRVIVFLTQLIRSYFNWLLSRVGMQNLFFFIFYTALLYNNMQFTEMLYHFMVEEGFNKSGESIEKITDLLQNYLN